VDGFNLLKCKELQGVKVAKVAKVAKRLEFRKE
jgi:hypothetical protein